MRCRIPANRTDDASRCSGAAAGSVARSTTRAPSVPMRSAILAIPVLCALPAVSHAERGRIELNGTWDFKLDPQDQGLASRWPEGAAAFDRTIVVPGAWQAQGVGEPQGTLRHDYAGPAWYRRTVAVPAAWRG